MSSVSTQTYSSRTQTGFPIFAQVLALIAIVGVLFVWQLRHFSPFMTDDAYISLRYSQRLLEGHGLTWNDMRPVEGYTNFLWVVLCAALGLLGLPLPLAAHILGITTALLILVAIVLYIYREFPSEVRFFASLLACSAMVLSSPFAVWALGGLEQPLLACMLAWAALFLLPWLQADRPSTGTAIVIGVFLGLAVISRADAALFTAAFFAAAVLADGVSAKSIVSRARVLPIPVLFFLGQLMFRRLYYQDWVPNTAHVKVAFTLHRLYTGCRYVYMAIRMDIVLVALVVIASVALWRAGRRKPVIFIWTVTVIWAAYLLVIGGDIFPAFRHFEPLVALFGFLFPGLTLMAIDVNHRLKYGVAIGLVAATALIASSDAMTEVERWEIPGESLGIFLHQAFGSQQALISSDAAGIVPFFAHLPSLDPLGLNDYHIAHEASRSRGYGWLGHELGDGKYILDQKPDLLLFSSFNGDNNLYPADQQVVDDPRFKQSYQPMNFDTPQPNGMRAFIYIRRIDGRIGMESTPTSLTVPAYLSRIDAANSVHLVDGKAALTVAAKHDATYERLPITAGEWKIKVDADKPSTFALTSLQGADRVPGCDLCVDAKAPANISITLANQSDTPATLKTVALVQR